MPRASTIVKVAFERARQNAEEQSAANSDAFGDRKRSSNASAEISYSSTRGVISDRYIPESRLPSRSPSTPLDSPEIQECRAASSRLMAVSTKNLFEAEQQIFAYDHAEKVMDYHSQRRRSIQAQISDMATTRTAITKVDAAKRSTAYNDMLFDVCGIMLERRGASYFVSAVRHGSLAQEDGVNNGHELLGVDFNKDTPEYGRAEGQEIRDLTLEGICELIAGAPDLDPGLVGFENSEGEARVAKYGTQLRFRAVPAHLQTAVSSEKMKEKIHLLRSSAKNVGIHEGLILRNCWTLFSELNQSGTGQLSEEDLAVGLRDVLRLKANDEQVAEMFKAADVSETGTISFADFKETVVQVSSTVHFPERFNPWLAAKPHLIRILLSPDKRSEMDALRPPVVVTAGIHGLAAASLLGVSLSRWKEEDKAREQWDGLEQDSIRLIRGMFLIGCLLVGLWSTVLSMRRSSPVFMAISFMLTTAMSVFSVIMSVVSADHARADGERRGEIVLAMVMVLTSTMMAAFMCMLLIRVSCFIWFRAKVNQEIRDKIAREIPIRTRLARANAR